MRLIQSELSRIKAPRSGQCTLWDDDLKGFGLRIGCRARSFFVRYRNARGRQCYHTIGRPGVLNATQARDAARDFLAKVRLGTDPDTVRQALRQKAREAASFSALARECLERHFKPNNRSWAEQERMIDEVIAVDPTWRDRIASEITNLDAANLLDQVVAKSAKSKRAARGGRIHGNRVRAMLRRVFKFGVQRGVVRSNPVADTARPWARKEPQRDRVLSHDEIRQVWAACEGESAELAAIFRLALLTAQRESEIMEMPWSELDLDGGWWTIPGDRTKNKLTQRVPLVGQALDILRERDKSRADAAWVFPGTRGKGKKTGAPVACVRKPMVRIREAADIKDFRFHDLRRTAASHMTGLGIPRLTVKKILNHADRDVTAIYDRHSYDSEKRAALIKWDREIARIVASA